MVDRRKEVIMRKLFFDITHICNKNCSLCSKKISTSNYKYTTKEEYKYVVSCIEDLDNINFIELTGGEPICHPHFKWLIREMLSDFPKADISIETNGRLLPYIETDKEIFNNRRIIFVLSVYPGWNDNIVKKYGDNFIPILPIFFERITNIIFNRAIYKYFKKRSRLIKRIERFFRKPFAKYHNIVVRGKNIHFINPYRDPNLDEVTAKRVREKCIWYVYIQGLNLYNCCISDVAERYYKTESVHIKFDKDWKKKVFRIPTWKACQHCWKAGDIIKYEKYLGIDKVVKYEDVETKWNIFNIFNHSDLKGEIK